MQCLCRSLDGIQCDINIRRSHWDNSSIWRQASHPYYQRRVHTACGKNWWHFSTSWQSGLHSCHIQAWSHSQHQWLFSGSCCYARYTTLKGSASMALDTMGQYDMHHEHPRHRTFCLWFKAPLYLVAKFASWGIVVVFFVSGALKDLYFKVIQVQFGQLSNA